MTDYFSNARVPIMEPVERHVKSKITALHCGDIVIQYDGNQPFYMDVENAKELIKCIELAIADIEKYQELLKNEKKAKDIGTTESGD